jgi:5-methylcytosine-specific restriction enzyme A
MTKRAEFSKKTKAEAFQRAKGHCEKCSAPLRPGKFEYHHHVEAALGGPNTLENCAVWCDACHDPHTAKVSTPRVAKMKRQQAAHIGAKAPAAKSLQSAGFRPAPPQRKASKVEPGSKVAQIRALRERHAAQGG